MKRSITFGLLAIGLGAAFGADAAGRALALGAVLDGDARNARALESLLANPATRDIRVVRVDAAAVDAGTGRLELDVGGRRVGATLERFERSASGNLVWAGSLDGSFPTRSGIDPLNSATLVRNGDRITGTIRVQGELYRIRPLPSGDHAIVRVDESAMPADHPEDAYREMLARSAADRITVRAKPGGGGGGGGTPVDPGQTQTIRVMVVATNGAVSAYGGDMAALVDLAVAETNQGYANSNVGIQMVLAAYATTGYGESGSFGTDLARFRTPNDGFMDEIHALRDQSAADVGMLVIDNPTACGLASGIGSTASTAFASAHWDCITGYYSFAHEVGHLQSARHDPATDPSTSPYAWGHGYRYEPRKATGWRTIMAYNCSRGCPRLNYWSNPAVSYGGVAMGTYDKSHNQRVLVDTKATIAGFR